MKIETTDRTTVGYLLDALFESIGSPRRMRGPRYLDHHLQVDGREFDPADDWYYSYPGALAREVETDDGFVEEAVDLSGADEIVVP